MAATKQSKTQIKPFEIKIPQSALDELQKRLGRMRWPDEAEGAGWSMGTNLGYMKKLADYWQHQYNWRKHEAALNQFHHFKTTIDGIEVHFVHELEQVGVIAGRPLRGAFRKGPTIAREFLLTTGRGEVPQ